MMLIYVSYIPVFIHSGTWPVYMYMYSLNIGLFHLIGVYPPMDDTVRGCKNISCRSKNWARCLYTCISIYLVCQGVFEKNLHCQGVYSLPVRKT